MKAILAILLVAIVASTASAAMQMPNFNQLYPEGHVFCTKPNFRMVDKSQYYQTNATVPKKACVIDYLDVCYGANGVIACNKANSDCVDDPKIWNANVMTARPQVCSSAGTYWHTDTGVLVVAQPIVAIVLITTYFIIVGVAIRKHSMSVLTVVLASLQLVFCILLTFSVFYLNAYIAMAATITALALYSTRCRLGVAVAMISLFAALLWLTYSPGLAYAQHGSRINLAPVLSAGSPLRVYPTSTHRLDEMCIQYYHSYFAWPEETKEETDSPYRQSWGYCNREFLAAELFFVIFVELLLILLIAAGPAQITSDDKPASEETTAVQQEEQTAAREEAGAAAAQ